MEDFKKEISKFYINSSNIYKNICNKSIYKQLFKNPVKNIFYWCEEDYTGSIFTVYEYLGKYICVYGEFGSCTGCGDIFLNFIEDEDVSQEDLQEKLNQIFSNIIISENINDINLHNYNINYTNPDLINKYNLWLTQTLL